MSHLRKVYILDSNGNPLEAVSGAIPILKTALYDKNGNSIEAVSGSVPQLKVSLYDIAGTRLKTGDNRLIVHDADLHDKIVNDQFIQDGATSTTLSVAASAGDTSITVASTAGLLVGNELRIGDATGERHMSIITALPGGGVITLNFPLDYDYAIGEAVQLVSTSLNVTGTLASPQSFILGPQTGDEWHVTSLQISMNHTTAGDNGLFGDLAVLTNGVILRRVDGASGQTNIMTVWRSGDDIAIDGGDIVYAGRGGGGGTYGTNAIWAIKNLSHGFEHLNGTAGDYLEILVQDDLSTLLDFKVHAQGHYDEVVIV